MIEFLRKIYPFAITDPYVAEEIYQKLGTATFKEGDTIKDYDEYSKEIYIIFSGEAALMTKTFDN